MRLVLPARGVAVAGFADFPLDQRENLRVVIIWKIAASLDVLPVREPIDCGPGDGRGGGVGCERGWDDDLVFSVTVQISYYFTKVRGYLISFNPLYKLDLAGVASSVYRQVIEERATAQVFSYYEIIVPICA